ncbi:DUF969 domain-containing protein [Erysipelothrix sp. HDW6C]|uniref:DUF969 domain-containing protein n=1 Tax=Erysipelothrix sp. HDW6C TaxID=2714930 RepID=UPI0014073D8C|nr:DUF969 domain-containing protein [Erysipelothrix sp. HDW6C]QIK69747.1 DUF969 domain-containing protein [Erysipelothrix sp. HDW6C]
MADMNLWLIVGIAIIIVGFTMKIDSIAVVLVSAIVTALIGGISFGEILDILGSRFVSGRGISIFILTLPIVGLSERYGLREQAVKLIQKMSSLTAGRVMWLYQVVRQLATAFSLRLGGHAQFVRPLIQPMAEGAAINERNGEPLNEDEADVIKAAAAAVDNYANFFGQNMFPAAGGVTLIVTTLVDAGYTVTPSQIALYSLPVFIIVLILSGIQLTMLDRKLAKGGKR